MRRTTPLLLVCALPLSVPLSGCLAQGTSSDRDEYVSLESQEKKADGSQPVDEWFAYQGEGSWEVIGVRDGRDVVEFHVTPLDAQANSVQLDFLLPVIGTATLDAEEGVVETSLDAEQLEELRPYLEQAGLDHEHQGKADETAACIFGPLFSCAGAFITCGTGAAPACVALAGACGLSVYSCS